VGAKLASTWHL